LIKKYINLLGTMTEIKEPHNEPQWVKVEDIKSLLTELDIFLANAYSAYIHTGLWEIMEGKPRITLDEVYALQYKIRRLAGVDAGTLYCKECEIEIENPKNGMVCDACLKEKK